MPFKVYSQENRAGVSHTTDTQVIQKVIAYRLHFVPHGFWFSGLQTQTLIHLTALDLSIFVYTYIFFLSYHNVNASSEYHSPEWGKNQSLEQGWAGNVSVGYLLSPDDFYQSSTAYLKPNYSKQDPVVLLGRQHPSTGAT